MTATAHNAISLGITAPIAAAFRKHLHIIVGVLRFHKGQLANGTGLDDLLRLLKTGGIAADLTHHELFVALFHSCHNGIDILTGQRQRFFTQNVQASLQTVLDHLPMILIRTGDDHRIQIFICDHVHVVQVATVNTQFKTNFI